MLVDLQMRVQGVGRGSDSAFQSVMVSGGTRGAGVAAIAKLAAICAGTAGTAAVCAATGILPTAGLVPDRKEEPRPTTAAVAREAKPRAVPMEFTEADEIPEAPIQDKPEQVPVPPDPVAPVTVVEEEPVVVQPAPVPTPTETEFTPEAAGTPAPAAAPPPQPTSNQVPVSNGGGEFAP